MQITNQGLTNTASMDLSFDVKKDEIYSAQIKQRISDKEAVLQIRGKEFVAEFEGKVPAGERATVQVTSHQEDKLNVKSIQSEVTKTPNLKASDLSAVLQKVGLTSKDAPELREAARLLLDKGYPLSKEVVSELKAFFEKGQGSPETKSDTVRALVNKGLEVTQTHLRSIHEALHGKPLNEVLTNLAKELNLDTSGKREQAVFSNVKEGTITAKATENVAKAPLSNEKAYNQTAVREAVSQIRSILEKEADPQKAIQAVKTMIANNVKMDREVVNEINKVISDAEKLQSIGKDRLVQTLNRSEAEMVAPKAVAVDNRAEQSRPVSNASLSEVVRELRNQVSSNPNLQKSIEKVQTELLNNRNLSADASGRIAKAITEATALMQQGRITTGKEVLSSALASVEHDAIDLKPSEVIRQGRETVQQEPRLQRAIEQVREQVVQNPKVDREIAQKVERALQEASQLQRTGQESAGRERIVQALKSAEVEATQPEARNRANAGADQRPAEVIRQARESVQQEPRLQRAIEQVREQIVQNPKIDREIAQKVERALQEASQLQRTGQESAGRERIVQALSSAGAESVSREGQRSEAPAPVRQGSQETAQPEARSRANTSADQRSAEVIRQARETVQQEPRLQRAIEQVREQVVQNPKIDREIAQKVERALQEASQLQRSGQESAGRERIVQALSSAEAESVSREGQRSEAPAPVRQGSQETVPPDSRRMESQLNQANAKTAQTQQTAPSQTVELKETIRQVREQLQAGQDVKKVLQEQVLKSPSIDPDMAKNIEKALKQADQLSEAGRERLTKLLQQLEASALKSQPQTAQAGQQVNQNTQQTESQSGGETKPMLMPKLPSETVQQALKQFHNEPDVEKALNLVRKEVSSNPNMDVKNIAKIEEALERAQQLNDRGREIASRQHVANELTQIQKSLALSEPKVEPTQGMNSQYDVNELLQSMQVQSKDILVTRVTQKLAEATHEFRDLKREITRNLDSVQRTIDTFKGSAQPQASKMLETAISKLDNAILKSDLMLFTDMKTERQLLQASSQLADAKKLLAKGNFSEASKIVGQVKELIDKLNFKPSEQKIMHFVSKESLAMDNRHAPLEAGARGFSLQEPSGRQMFEMVRSLGLNHDSDLANSLVFKNGEHNQQEQQNNMKAALMKLQQEEANPRVAQQAEQALNNLTGQQLLSKADSPGTMQNMLFNLPLLLGGKPENLQVFVNSKNEGQQVDWENCNLYFLIETKKLGDVGIMLSATERNLTITIKNDKPGFKEKMEPLANMAKDKLNEIGYNVNALHFTRMTPIKTQSQPDQTIEQKPQKPIFTEKGMDFRI